MSLLERLRKRFTSENIRSFIQECEWMGKYIVRYKGAIVFHVLIGMIGIVMVLVSSVASKVLIDAVVGKNSGAIGSAAAWMIGMRLGSILFKSASSQLGAFINIKVQNEIQHELYVRILKTDWQSLEMFHSGDLLQRISSDASLVSSGVTSFIPTLLTNLVQFVGAFVIILSTDPIMALITLVGVPLSAFGSRVILRKMTTYSREMKEMQSEVVSFQQESLENITDIKSFGLMGWYGQQMLQIQEKYRSKALQHSRFSVLMSGLMNLLSLIAYIGCFMWGVYRLWQGRISYGEMSMFLQLSGMLGGAFSSLVSLIPVLISITTSARRVMGVCELDEEDLKVPEGFLQEKSFTLSLSQVDFEYNGGAPVLKQVNFEAQDGQLVSLSGPSGEGKTTLLRIVLGLVKPTSGVAELIGESGRHYALSAATRSVFGYVPQGNHIFTGSVAQNLRLAKPDAMDEELMEVLKIACADDFVMKLSGGLDHEIGGRDKRLSEGQAQRLAVARALLKKAPILLLDEATSALDRETEEKMLNNLMASDYLRTCILVTHRDSALKICSKNFVIRDSSMNQGE